MSSRTASDVGVIEVGADDGFDMFDQVVRENMGMSGEDFLHRWDAGAYNGVDFDDIPGLVQVWMYLPFVR